MRIVLNGTDAELREPCTVVSLLEQQGLAQRPCAVEVNRELVPKAQHAAYTLSEGDTVEVVSLVGGG